MITTTVAMPAALHRRVMAAAAAQRIPMTELLRRSLSVEVESDNQSATEAMKQRFASPYLTHFVGRRVIEDDVPPPDRETQQYQILAAILRSRYLADHPGAAPGILAYGMGMNNPICSNQMFNVAAVCFCDIPLDDLGVHMGKYGQFGISFRKPFLIARGASPVFYVATNSYVRTPDTGGGAFHQQMRGDYFNEMSALYAPVHAFIFSGGTHPEALEDPDLHQLLRTFPGLREHPAASRLEVRLNALIQFLDAYVFGYIKCFDDSLPDEDANNFYLEREWRAVRRVDFGFDDISYVIVPGSFVGRLQADFPDLRGDRILVAEDCYRSGAPA